MRKKSEDRSINLFTEVDDAMYDALSELVGQQVLHVAVWEESLSDELDGATLDVDEMAIFDIDLYLADGIYFELYGTLCFVNLNREPLQGLDPVSRRLIQLVSDGVTLEEIAVDEEDALVLVLGQRQQHPAIYLSIGGWLLEEWNELPE